MTVFQAGLIQGVVAIILVIGYVGLLIVGKQPDNTFTAILTAIVVHYFTNYSPSNVANTQASTSTTSTAATASNPTFPAGA